MATNTGVGSTLRSTSRAIPVVTLALTLSTFFALSYLICIAGYLLLPGLPIQHAALSNVLPGFSIGNWPGFFLGLAESVAWGWYVALGFGTLYNMFAARS